MMFKMCIEQWYYPLKGRIKNMKKIIFASLIMIVCLSSISSMADEEGSRRYYLTREKVAGTATSEAGLNIWLFDSFSGNIYFTSFNMIAESQKIESKNRGKYWNLIPGPNDNNIANVSLDSKEFEKYESAILEESEKGKQENKESLK